MKSKKRKSKSIRYFLIFLLIVGLTARGISSQGNERRAEKELTHSNIDSIKIYNAEIHKLLGEIKASRYLKSQKFEKPKREKVYSGR